MTERHIRQNKLARYLEVEVGVLPSGDLVLVDVGVARLHGCRAVEGRVQSSGHLPVLAVVKHFVQLDACNSSDTPAQLPSTSAAALT